MRIDVLNYVVVAAHERVVPKNTTRTVPYPQLGILV